MSLLQLVWTVTPYQSGKMNGFAAIDIHPTGVMLLKRQQPDKPAAASNKFCSICTLYGVYTESGIDPWPTAMVVILGSYYCSYSFPASASDTSR